MPRVAVFAGILVLLVVQAAGIMAGVGPLSGSREKVGLEQPPSASSPVPTASILTEPAAVAVSQPLEGAPAAMPAPPQPVSTPAIPLQEQLESYVAGLDGIYGLAVSNLRSGETILIDADRVFPAASLYKLLVMYRAYQLMEAGELSSDTAMTVTGEDLLEADEGDALSPGDQLTVSEAVEAMITYSHNPAAYVLARNVGGWESVIESASELGMDSTTFDGEYFLTSPADILRFFELLGTGALVSAEADEEMISVLLRQEKDDRIPAGLPPWVGVAHKTGELPELRHDAGLVFADNEPYVLVIMSEEIDPDAAAEAHASISRMVFERFRS